MVSCWLAMTIITAGSCHWSTWWGDIPENRPEGRKQRHWRQYHGSIPDSLHHTDLVELDKVKTMEHQSQFGDEPLHKVEAELHNWLEDAIIAGFFLQSCTLLKEVLEKYQRTFTLRPDSVEAAEITSITMSLITGKNPTRVKIWRYPSDQRAFLDKYFPSWCGSFFPNETRPVAGKEPQFF